MEREFAFTSEDFAECRRLAFHHAGITLGEQKQQLVYGRLARRLRVLGLTSFRDYLTRLTPDNPSELTEFTNAITTNLTAFFREPHHFQTLGEQLSKLPSGSKVRIWSAGCSTGQEPYTIAMTALETRRDLDVRILASDIDSNVLAKAQQGVYSMDLAKDIPPRLLKKYWLRGTGANAEMLRAKDSLREVIQFRQLNLTKNWAFQSKMDHIFCRNVIIYFDRETKIDLVRRFGEILTPKGLLFVGHSESLHQIADDFALLGRTTYRKAAG